jgi:uncharacterized protein YjiS (DUF1127 family)
METRVKISDGEPPAMPRQPSSQEKSETPPRNQTRNPGESCPRGKVVAFNRYHAERRAKMNSRMNSAASAALRLIARQSWTARLSVTLKRLWVAYRNSRMEQAAIIHLSTMNEVQLKDLGLTRSQISSVVKEGRVTGVYF